MRVSYRFRFGFLTIIAATAIAAISLSYAQSAKAPSFRQPFAPIQSAGAPRSYSEAVERASPSVVSIQSTHATPKEMTEMLNNPMFQQFFGIDPRNAHIQEAPPSIGSGVIVSTDGYILTNNHVIKEARDIEVKLPDGRKVPAKVIGSDPDSDVAILQIKINKLPPPIALGDSDLLKPGDVVLAIGSPFGLGNTVSMGIVSATHRNELGINAFENFIQTDAAINPGNSGGPLINADGNMVGINNVIYTRSGGFQGIGFAIPINLAKEVISELIQTGHITRGWLGITVRKLTDELRASLKYPKGDGAVIAGVMRSGPANVAGILPGDIIISLNGKNTKDPAEVLSIASKLKPNQTVNIALIRGGQIYDFRVVIGKRPVQTAQTNQPRQPQPRQPGRGTDTPIVPTPQAENDVLND